MCGILGHCLELKNTMIEMNPTARLFPYEIATTIITNTESLSVLCVLKLVSRQSSKQAIES